MIVIDKFLGRLICATYHGVLLGQMLALFCRRWSTIVYLVAKDAVSM